MQISELVSRSGVTLASVKFYLREGMLSPGEAVHARRAEYGDAHLERLLVIKALTTVAGLPLARTKRILQVLDHPDGALTELLAEAIGATADDRDDVIVAEEDLAEEYPRAFRATAMLGPVFRPRMPAVAQLDRALEAAEEAGLAAVEERARSYGPSIQAIAEAELADLPADDPAAAVQYAVLGTTLYEPVLAALRRLAHQNIVSTRHQV
ncbi:DNA-binding transcriptional regulator, MerR family [Rathayibacter oskolensis]|uniref:DNA-binding transcriptional regulator, MerR family n=1 Tax=Rathayibacter oskolensis TaxID=1891671 RepID=A0A1X7NEQ4_9MICO|nr:MerR family transcriptional regulator [Rathayibacter oskolensis]SMH36224.1 DNA-binding transcriptional regulator, MerR family [Rathayibacter oskolensis]